MAGTIQEDARLRRDGKLGKVKVLYDQILRLGSEETNDRPEDDKTMLEDRHNNRRGVYGYTPLHEAVSRNKYKVIPDLCRSKKADVNARANSGYTPLHIAANAGHIESVKVLLEIGADISRTDDYGKTPKETAGLSSKPSIVRLLKSEGRIPAVIY